MLKAYRAKCLEELADMEKANGSQKSKNSNTFQITTTFLDRRNSNKSNSVEVVDISKANIGHCLGCYACWTKMLGERVVKDDMAGLIEKYINADLIIMKLSSVLFWNTFKNQSVS